jgi:hypothetical protein
MTYIAYTTCDTGHRFFADVNGLCVSYDQKLIKRIVADVTGAVQNNKQHVEAMEASIREMKAQQAIPPIVDVVIEHNRRVVQEQINENKRLPTAEAVLNDQLVRDVMYFEDIKDAISYTVGAA